jgi:hypothetical protein
MRHPKTLTITVIVAAFTAMFTYLAQPTIHVLADDVLGFFTMDGSFNNTTMSFAVQGKVNNCDPGAMGQADQGGPGVNFAAYGLAGCAAVPSNSTNHEGGGVFGAVSNASTTTNPVGGSFYCQAAGDGIDGNSDLHRVRCWGINPLLADHGYNHTLLLNELDYNISGPDTKVIGLFSAGASQHQLAPGSAWMLAGPIGPGVSWPLAYGCADGSSAVCLQLGARSTGNNTTSQIVRWFSRDAGGVTHYTDMTLDANGNLAISFAGGNPVWINKDGSITAKAFHTY